MTAPQPLFRLTGGEDFPRWAKLLLTGPPKSGKTSFLGSVPNIVIADTEPDANNLQSIAHLNLPYVTVNGSSDLQRLLIVLGDPSLRAQAAQQLGMEKIEAVGIDTLDTLQQILKRERMRETGSSKFVRDDWSWLKDEMQKIIAAFTRLPLHVIFTVHIKTETIGPEDDQSTIFWPSLQGAIDKEIGGMVGYSFLTFRQEELRQDGSKYTRYLLRAEGNDTYSFVGNRAAGKLPDIINPNFGEVVQVIEASRAAISSPVQPTFTGQPQAPAATPQAQAAPAPQQPAPQAAPAPQQPAPQAAPPQEVAQSSGQAQQPAAPVQTDVQTQQAPQQAPPQPPQPPTHATPDGQPASGRPDDNEPVSPTGLGYAKKVYEACGLTFPQAEVAKRTLGEVRGMVSMWKAIQADGVEGKLQRSPAEEMAHHLRALTEGDVIWLVPADVARVDGGNAAPQSEPEPVAPDPNGTIAQVLAYIGDDLARAQEVYDAEVAKSNPRSSLINQLESRGVRVQTPVQTEPSAPVATPQPETETVASVPPQPAPDQANQASAPPAPPVTQEPSGADDPNNGPLGDAADRQALATLADKLDAVPVAADGSVMKCQVCDGEIDDEDIATLALTRYGKRMCVTDYIQQTKQPATA